MKKLLKLNVFFISLILFFLGVLYAQKVETIDGVRVVHNGKDGQWGKNPKVSLEFFKTIGSLETENENLAFYIPSDIAFDSEGNIYILDSGNHRIQKFDPEGKFITTIGNKGQGPAEFYLPQSVDIDSKGYLYVSDPQNQRVQILNPYGKEHKTISFHKTQAGIVRVLKSGDMIMGKGGSLVSIGMGGMDETKTQPKLIKVLDLEGNIQKDFGEPLNYKDVLMNRTGNQLHFTIDKNDYIYIAFDYQNRIEKFSPDGKLLWKSDRKLNYNPTSPGAKSGLLKRSGGRVVMREPQMNMCSNGIAVDDKGRVWVVTLKRQIRDDESVQTGVRAMMVDGQRSVSLSFSGNTEKRETDMYLLEVFAPDGILLGKLPLHHFVDDIRIKKDRVFLLDKIRGMLYYEYKISEK